MKKILCAILGMTMCLGLTGCQESDTANHNLRVDANNFKISRKVVALNTRTNEPLFSVEGKISIETDIVLCTFIKRCNIYKYSDRFGKRKSVWI